MAAKKVNSTTTLGCVGMSGKRQFLFFSLPHLTFFVRKSKASTASEEPYIIESNQDREKALSKEEKALTLLMCSQHAARFVVSRGMCVAALPGQNESKRIAWPLAGELRPGGFDEPRVWTEVWTPRWSR